MLFKRVAIFIILKFCFCFFNAQTNTLLVLKHNNYEKELIDSNYEKLSEKKRGIGNFFLTLYQKHISPLISADCLYTLSCSGYSREAINKYGLMPGVLLSADRLTRCSFFCRKDIPQNKFTHDGFAEDNP